MLIDVHAHYSPKAYLETMARVSGGRRPPSWNNLPHTDSPEDVETRLRFMDEAGVQMQVFSTGILAPYAHREADAVEAARITNDAYAEATRRYPDRFASFVNLPLPHVDASLREMERGFDQLGMVGVTMNCSAFEHSAAESRFDPLYQEMNRRGAVVYYHPCGNNIRSPMIGEYGIGGIGPVLEDSVLVTHLIVRQIPIRYPNLKIIISHLGGLIPTFLDRMDHQIGPHALAEPASTTARRFYYDTVGHGSAAALLAAWKAFGADHLVPGSDWPVLLASETYVETFDYVRRSELPQDDIDKIIHRNAPALFNLPA